MPLEIQCPKCNERYSCPERHAGKTIPCPNCKGPIQVPKSAEKTDSPSEEKPQSKEASAEAWSIQTPEGREIGPLAKSTLDQLVLSKDFSGSLIRKDDASEWEPIGNVYPAFAPKESKESREPPETPGEAWFIQTPEGQEIGPLKKSKLDKLILTKDFSGCLIRKDDAEWEPVENVYPELAAAALAPEPPADAWFIRTPEGQEIGPLKKAKLDQLIHKKDFSGCHIRKEGSSEWKPIGEAQPVRTAAELPRAAPLPAPADHAEASGETAAEEPPSTQDATAKAKPDSVAKARTGASALTSGIKKLVASVSKKARPDAAQPGEKTAEEPAEKTAKKGTKTVVKVAIGCGGVLVVAALVWGVLAMRGPSAGKKTDVNDLSVKDGACYIPKEVRLPQSAVDLREDLMKDIYAIAKNRPEVKQIEFSFWLDGGVDQNGNPLEKQLMGKIAVGIEELEGARNCQDVEAYLKSDWYEIYEMEIENLQHGNRLT